MCSSKATEARQAGRAPLIVEISFCNEAGGCMQLHEAPKAIRLRLEATAAISPARGRAGRSFAMNVCISTDERRGAVRAVLS